MKYKNFSRNEVTHHDLDGGLALDSAPERGFGIHSAVYRQANPEFFQTFLEYGSDLEGLCYCFWVTEDKRRVGGIIIRPNHIEGLFVIPPFADAYGILAAVKPLLLHWSDKEKDIEAVDVLPHEVDVYHRLGFRTDCIRRHLIRPTQSFDVSWDKGFEVRVPGEEDLQQVAELHLDSFSGGVRPWGEYGLEAHVEKARKHFFDRTNDGDIFRRASALVYETRESRLVCSCLVVLSDGVPALSYLAVRPAFRRRGLARNMIRRALTVLKDEYPLLKVQVFVGNPAESMYYAVGFQPGVERYSLRIPAGSF